MNISNAYAIVEEGKPPDADSVDLECPRCAGQWQSQYSDIHNLGDKHQTVYNKYVGDKNTIDNLETFTYKYKCPNKCKEYLQYIHEVGNKTPYDEWVYATLLIKKYELQCKLDEVNKELQRYG